MSDGVEKGRRAVKIRIGPYTIVILLKGDPKKYAEGWLDADKDRRDLKEEAKRLAREDATYRAKRRGQL